MSDDMGEILEAMIKCIMAPLYGFESIALDETEGLRISTVYAGDVSKFETAIIDQSGTHPVEHYATKGEAVLGHQRWVVQSPTLTKIKTLDYGVLSGEEINLVRFRATNEN